MSARTARRAQSGKSSAKSRSSRQRGHDADDAASYNVRFDYSNTYLDNEDLAARFENQADELYREKHRMCVETDDLLKKAKKDADEMLQLKNKVKNRDPNESSDKVINTADLKRRASVKLTQKIPVGVAQLSANVADEAAVKDDEALDTIDGKDNNDKSVSEALYKDADKENGGALNGGSKPLNTLTMFLLSLHTFKRAASHGGKRSDKDDKCDKSRSSETSKRKKSLFEKSSSASLIRRPSSYSYTDRRSRDAVHADNIQSEADGKAQYGIHVRKDFSRSRRALEELSKLEQDSKYGYVNKYEERRKKLLAECKDTKALQERIKYFLKEVDEFKVMSSNENSLEKILMRSKSAHLPRISSFT